MIIARVRKKMIAAAVAILSSAALLAVSASPAGAHQWTETTGWGGYSHLIGVSPHLTTGNAPATWQMFMHAQYSNYGYGPPLSAPYKTDGTFDINDKNVTIVWQTQAQAIVPSMVVDGIVGPQSLNFARMFNLVQTAAYSSYRDYCYGVCSLTTSGSKMRLLLAGEGSWRIAPWGCDYGVIDHPTVDTDFWYSCY